MSSVTVHFGWLRRIVGGPVSYGGFLFVGALLDLDNEPQVDRMRRCELTPDHPLAEHIGMPVPDVLASCDVLGYGFRQDALWVRARIPVVFRFAPVNLTKFDCKYSLLDQTFLACEPSGTSGNWAAYPFVCLDYGLQAGLRFSTDGPAREVRDRIARAFWGLLLQSPNDLHPFHDGYVVCDPDMGDQGWETAAFECGRFTVDGVDMEEGEQPTL